MINNTLDFNIIGKGVVSSEKVRVYHRFWGKLVPAKIRLDWNDDDSVPFVYYLDQKGRIQFGSSDERYPDLLSKIERCRFNYPHIWLSGRLWSKRKIIVIDQFNESNWESTYGSFHEFLEIIENYIEGIKEYKLVFPQNENKGVVYMNLFFEVYERCLRESMHKNMMMHSPVGGRKNMVTGLSDIDRITGGLKKSELIIIAGRPGMGKTSLLVTIAKNLLTRVPIAFFSLKMSRVKLVDRILSNACCIRVGTLSNGQISHDEWDRFDQNIENILTSKLYIDDSPELSLEEMESKIIKMVEEHSVKIVMIDSLPMINGHSNSQMENLAKSLELMKDLAKRMEIVIVAVSCLFHGKKAFYCFPKFSDHREYQAICQFADWSFYIYRTDKYLTRRIFSQNDNAVSISHVEIMNHNTNKSGLAILEYDKRCMRFNNLYRL